MAKVDSRRTVLEIINEVRRLIGYSTVSSLDSDKHSLVLLRLLNVVVEKISTHGDWQEMQRTATVTARSSASEYSVGSNEPIKRIYEISYHTNRQSLYPITLEEYNQYQRSGSFGVPRFFCIKGVDSQGNPNFRVYRTPITAQTNSGQTFSVEYFVNSRLFDTSSADDEVVFPANLVIQGLYARALAEEAGGIDSKESFTAERDFILMMDETLKRYNSDTGTDIYLQPRRR